MHQPKSGIPIIRLPEFVTLSLSPFTLSPRCRHNHASGWIRHTENSEAKLPSEAGNLRIRTPIHAAWDHGAFWTTQALRLRPRRSKEAIRRSSRLLPKV